MNRIDLSITLDELSDEDINDPDADTEREAGDSAAFTFDLAPYAFPDPASIPPREWLYGRHYIRGAVSASIGAPGRLKSTTVLTEIVGMTAGRDLMTGEPLASGPLRAAYFNGEETQDELDRRVAAICVSALGSSQKLAADGCGCVRPVTARSGLPSEAHEARQWFDTMS